MDLGKQCLVLKPHVNCVTVCSRKTEIQKKKKEKICVANKQNVDYRC